MASSEDFKKLYELYQTGVVPNGVSIVDFCQRNGNAYLFMSKNRRTVKINLCLTWNAKIS